MDTGVTKKTVVVVNSCNTIQTLLDINAMIDIHAKHLEGLRTQCSTSAELIQQEIRTIEVRYLLVKLIYQIKTSKY
jgi:kinase suppressor of Ras 2